jgi:hypothetical protein
VETLVDRAVVVAQGVESAGQVAVKVAQGVELAGRVAGEAGQAQAERAALVEAAVRRPAARKVVRRRQTPTVVAVVRSAARVEEAVNSRALVWAHWPCAASIWRVVDEEGGKKADRLERAAYTANETQGAFGDTQPPFTETRSCRTGDSGCLLLVQQRPE